MSPTQATFLQELEASLAECPPGGLTLELRFRDQPWWDSLAALTLLAVFDSTSSCACRRSSSLSNLSSLGLLYPDRV